MTDTGISRRAFGQIAAAATLASCAPQAGPTMAAPASRRFPPDFLWGVANAAFQTEGALTADGRGPSVWDVFPRARIHDGSDASLATDSYRRYPDDIALAAGLGVKAFRFSISWPRIFPTGAGPLNEAGLDHYKRVVDAMLEAGVQPYATLFHWDLPQALQEQGGWVSRETSYRFAEYADAIGRHMGDRLKHIIAMNEAAVHAVLGYVFGQHAPGLADADLLGPVMHHENLAQGLAIQALRAAQGDLVIGSTLALQPSRPGDGGLLSPLHDFAADSLDQLWNGGFLDPLLLGSYPTIARTLIGSALQEGDLAITKQPIDFLGVNYYAPAYMSFDAGAPSFIRPAPPPEGVELDAFARHVDPSGLYEMLLRVKDKYGNLPTLVTENGCSDQFSDAPGVIDDQFRIDYLRRHIAATKSAMEAGCNVGGYFHWTLIDNFEWAEGYRSKFGLVAMDRTSGVRTPKVSYAWFKALAETGLLDEG